MFLLLGYVCKLKQISVYQIGQILSTYWLFAFGVFFRRVNNANFNRYACVIGLVVLVICDRFISVDIAGNSYGNPFIFVLVSIAGWFFLFSISSFFAQSILLNPIKFLGKNTLCIVIFQNLSFKLLNCLYVLVTQLPYFVIAANPMDLSFSRYSWPFYVIIGITIPILINYIYKFSLHIFISKDKVKTA